MPTRTCSVSAKDTRRACREAVEESGWEPRSVEPLCAFYPANGLLGQRFHIFVSRDAVPRGEPTDRNEATRIDWFSVEEVRGMLRSGQITDGLSFGALAYALAGVSDHGL